MQAKKEQLSQTLLESFHKIPQIVIQNRIALPPEMFSSSGSKCTWFNLVLPDVEHIRSQIDKEIAWGNYPTTLHIDVCLSAHSLEKHILLERWKVGLKASNADSRVHDFATVYKKLLILMRQLMSLILILPSTRLVTATHSNMGDAPFALYYQLYSYSQEQKTFDSKSRDYSFRAIDTSLGRLHVMVLYRVDTDFEFARTKPANTNFFVIPEYFPTRPAYQNAPARQASLNGSQGRLSHTRDDEKGMTTSTSHSPVSIPPPPVIPAPKRNTPPFTAVNSRSREQLLIREKPSRSPAQSRRHGNQNVKNSSKSAQAAGFTVLESMSGDPWNNTNDKKKLENYHKRVGRSHSSSPAHSCESSHRSISGSPSLNATRQAHISDRPRVRPGFERRSSFHSNAPYPRFGAKQVQQLNVNRTRTASPYANNYSPLFTPGSARPSQWSIQPPNMDIGPPTLALTSLVTTEMTPPIRGLSENLGSHQTTPLNRLGLGPSCVPSGQRSVTESVERIREQFVQHRGENVDNLPPILALVSQDNSPHQFSRDLRLSKKIEKSAVTSSPPGKELPPFSLLDDQELQLKTLDQDKKEWELKLNGPTSASLQAEDSTGAFLALESFNGAEMSFALPGNQDEESLIGSFVQTCYRFDQLDLFKSQGRENWTLGELEKVVMELENRFC